MSIESLQSEVETLRTILHSDLNCFYASVEMNENPELRGKKVAVCGSVENRHGIVLTASYPAKRSGVKTGMAIWQAKDACPDLLTVSPHYDLYLKYSRQIRAIYKRYADDVEPFGMDECWISLPFGESESIAIAEEIRQTIKEETGLTVSIGVSFSKALAKLGSDMKKPDAITVLGRENFKEKCWDLPVSDLIYVGPRTTKKLNMMAIFTIGQLANAPSDLIAKKLGKNGLMVQSFANGTDCSAVAPADYSPPPKSIGHGATCVRDLEDNYSVWLALNELAQDVGHRMITTHYKTQTVHLYVKDNTFMYHEYVAQLHYPTQSSLLIAQVAYERFLLYYNWRNPVRALTITAAKLENESKPEQLDLFGDYLKHDKQNRLEKTIDEIRSRFGKEAIRSACLCSRNSALANDKCESVKMPNMMYR